MKTTIRKNRKSPHREWTTEVKGEGNTILCICKDIEKEKDINITIKGFDEKSIKAGVQEAAKATGNFKGWNTSKKHLATSKLCAKFFPTTLIRFFEHNFERGTEYLSYIYFNKPTEPTEEEAAILLKQK